MIRACIFDLGGTIVDKYSMTPFLSFKNAFQKQKIKLHKVAKKYKNRNSF